MPLNVNQLASTMLSGAATTAGNAWSQIQSAAVVEIRGLAQRLAAIAAAFVSGQITKDMARRHLRTARFHVIATIAMLTSVVEAAVERIINAALTAVRDAVNTAIGFTLV